MKLKVLSFTAIKRPWQLQCRSFHKSSRHFDPLRILFCGSDDFSVASLEALNTERLAKSTADIESIDVVCRPGKPTGAGLRLIRHLPIRNTAQQLGLPLHEIDTFTGWQPPAGINLIIAVSFGLFVPPRILNGAKYGGLNVHPSMLPDLRGPAPIHWTILLDRKHTGVTLQTLHPQKIDHGIILAQTAPPGMPYPDEATTKEMIPFMATKGADLLIKGLQYRVFESEEPITHSEASILEITDGKGIAHAPKITPEDRHISSWEDMDAATLLRKNRAIGHLWDITTFQRWIWELKKEFPHIKPDPIPSKRVIFSGGFTKYDINSSESSDGPDGSSQLPDSAAQANEDKARVQFILDNNHQPGQLIFLPRKRGLPKLLILTSDRKLLEVNSCTLESRKKDNGIKELWAYRTKLMKVDQDTSARAAQWTVERKENPKVTYKYQKLRLKAKGLIHQTSGRLGPKGQEALDEMRREANQMGDLDRFKKDFKELIGGRKDDLEKMEKMQRGEWESEW